MPDLLEPARESPTAVAARYAVADAIRKVSGRIFDDRADSYRRPVTQADLHEVLLQIAEEMESCN